MRYLKRKLLFINLLSFIINTSSSLVAPFFPPLAVKRNVPKLIIGIIISCHPIGSILFSLIIIKLMRFFDRKKLLFIGIIFQIVGNILLGYINNVDEYNKFIYMSIIGRLFQGMGFSSFTAIILAYIPKIYGKKQEKIENYIEMSSGLGTMIGPLIGSVLLAFEGYDICFYILAGLELLFIVPLYRNLPKELHSIDKSNKKLKMRYIFFSQEGFFTFILISACSCSYNFLDPSLSNRLTFFNLEKTYNGLFFTLSTSSYLLSMFIVSNFSHKIDRKVWMSTGILLISLMYFFLLNRDLIGLTLGLIFLGMGCALILVPSLQQYRAIARKVCPFYDAEAINNVTSGLFAASYALGELTGPILGGFLEDNFKFVNSLKYFGIGLFLYFFIYLFFGDALFGFLSVCVNDFSPENLEESNNIKENENIVTLTTRRITLINR